jgi:hypothetical protein
MEALADQDPQRKAEYSDAGVDLALIRETLSLTSAERLQFLLAMRFKSFGEVREKYFFSGQVLIMEAPQSGRPRTQSHRLGRLRAGRGRPINNRPQVTNLPHLASAICL